MSLHVLHVYLPCFKTKKNNSTAHQKFDDAANSRVLVIRVELDFNFAEDRMCRMCRIWPRFSHILGVEITRNPRFAENTSFSHSMHPRSLPGRRERSEGTRWQTSSVASLTHTSLVGILVEMSKDSLAAFATPSTSPTPPHRSSVTLLCHPVLHFLLVPRISQFWTRASPPPPCHIQSVLFVSATTFRRRIKDEESRSNCYSIRLEEGHQYWHITLFLDNIS